MSPDRAISFLLIALAIALLVLLLVGIVSSLRMGKLEDACVAAGGTPVRTNSTTLCVKEFMPYGPTNPP